MSNTYSRKADQEIYMEDRYNNPKECFKKIGDICNLSSTENMTKDKRMLDMGCATGESLYYYRQVNPGITLDGVEYLDSLVDRSKEFLSKYDINVFQGDAEDLSVVESESYDFVVSSGVSCIFDDFKPFYNEMIRVAKDKGTCVNHVPMNEMDVDVIVGYRDPKDYSLQIGWNKVALSSMEKYLEEHPRVDSFYFEKFELPFDLEKTDDPMRVWTVKNEEGKRLFWNGLNMEISQYFIVIKLK